MVKRTKLPIKLGKGINRDGPPFELAPGMWSDCQSMRFRLGCDEKVIGVAAVFTTPTVAPYALETFDVGTTSGTTRYIVQVGLAGVFVDDGTTRTDITRGLSGNTAGLSGSGAVVTVSSTAHGLTSGDRVIIAGYLPATYNTAAAGVIITVTTANAFTYVNTETAAVTQTGYWDSNRPSPFTTAAGDEITTCVLNGVLYVNTLKEGCYYWGGSVAAADSRSFLRRLRTTSGTNFGQHVFGRSIAAYKDYLFVFGYLGAGFGNATSASLTKKPYEIAWGNAAEPGSVPSTFAAANSNDAGSVQKTRGAMVHGRSFGETLYAYAERGICAIDYIGGNDVFSFRWLNGSDGTLAVNWAVNTPKGQVFLTQNRDVKIHTGGEAQSVAEGRMKQWFIDNIDATNYARTFLQLNKRYGEVNVFIPTTGNTNCNKALLWNWDADTWGERDVTNVTCATSGMLPTNIATDERLVIGTTTPTIGLVDSGTTYFGAAITSMVERIGMCFDNQSSVKNIHGTRWGDDGTVAAVTTISHGGGSMTPDAATAYVTATHTLGTTNWANAIATGGRYVAVKRSGTGAIGKCRTLEIDYTESGDF